MEEPIKIGILIMGRFSICSCDELCGSGAKKGSACRPI